MKRTDARTSRTFLCVQFNEHTRAMRSQVPNKRVSAAQCCTGQLFGTLRHCASCGLIVERTFDVNKVISYWFIAFEHRTVSARFERSYTVNQGVRVNLLMSAPIEYGKFACGSTLTRNIMFDSSNEIGYSKHIIENTSMFRFFLQFLVG